MTRRQEARQLHDCGEKEHTRQKNDKELVTFPCKLEHSTKLYSGSPRQRSISLHATAAIVADKPLRLANLPLNGLYSFLSVQAGNVRNEEDHRPHDCQDDIQSGPQPSESLAPPTAGVARSQAIASNRLAHAAIQAINKPLDPCAMHCCYGTARVVPGTDA